jgi:hypothetical protein
MPVNDLREVVRDEPALSDLILHAFLRRRSRLISAGGGVEIIGRRTSPETHRVGRPEHHRESRITAASRPVYPGLS